MRAEQIDNRRVGPHCGHTPWPACDLSDLGRGCGLSARTAGGGVRASDRELAMLLNELGGSADSSGPTRSVPNSIVRSSLETYFRWKLGSRRAPSRKTSTTAVGPLGGRL